MPRAVWDTEGTRVFEAGVDHGMLYVASFAGVPWNGLISVSENPSGGKAREFFIDGQKYLNLASPEGFEGTITAFSSPAEFRMCTGQLKLSIGLYADGQPRRKFGFSYRTLIGDDLSGTSSGQKIHLVYNATAKAPDFTHESVSTGPGVTPRSWDITTVPEQAAGFWPSSHFVIDSRRTDPSIQSGIEDIIYGTPGSDPRLPTIQELITLVGL